MVKNYIYKHVFITFMYLLIGWLIDWLNSCVYIYVCVHTCYGIYIKVTGQLLGIGSLPPRTPRLSPGSNTSHWAWCLVPFPSEVSCFVFITELMLYLNSSPPVFTSKCWNYRYVSSSPYQRLFLNNCHCYQQMLDLYTYFICHHVWGYIKFIKRRCCEWKRVKQLHSSPS